MPAIELSPGVKGVHFEDIDIGFTDVGIQARGPVEFTAKNVRFKEVARPWDIQGGRAEIEGTRITRAAKPKAVGKSWSGWRRPNGPPLPAFCPRCKSVFPSKSYNFGSSYVYARDNEEVCPVCESEHAKLSDGLFDLSREAVAVLTAPEMTFAMLSAIKDVADQLSDRRVNEADAVRRLRQVSPTFGAIAGRALQIGTAALTLMVAMAALYVSYEQLEVSKAQLDTALQQQDESLNIEQRNEAVLQILLDRVSKLTFVTKDMFETMKVLQSKQDDASLSKGEIDTKTKVRQRRQSSVEKAADPD
jgi:hypothetical protein